MKVEISSKGMMRSVLIGENTFILENPNLRTSPQFPITIELFNKSKMKKGSVSFSGSFASTITKVPSLPSSGPDWLKGDQEDTSTNVDVNDNAHGSKRESIIPPPPKPYKSSLSSLFPNQEDDNSVSLSPINSITSNNINVFTTPVTDSSNKMPATPLQISSNATNQISSISSTISNNNTNNQDIHALQEIVSRLEVELSKNIEGKNRLVEQLENEKKIVVKLNNKLIGVEDKTESGLEIKSLKERIEELEDENEEIIEEKDILKESLASFRNFTNEEKDKYELIISKYNDTIKIQEENLLIEKKKAKDIQNQHDKTLSLLRSKENDLKTLDANYLRELRLLRDSFNKKEETLNKIIADAPSKEILIELENSYINLNKQEEEDKKLEDLLQLEKSKNCNLEDNIRKLLEESKDNLNKVTLYNSKYDDMKKLYDELKLQHINNDISIVKRDSFVSVVETDDPKITSSLQSKLAKLSARSKENDKKKENIENKIEIGLEIVNKDVKDNNEEIKKLHELNEILLKDKKKLEDKIDALEESSLEINKTPLPPPVVSIPPPPPTPTTTTTNHVKPPPPPSPAPDSSSHLSRLFAGVDTPITPVAIEGQKTSIPPPPPLLASSSLTPPPPPPNITNIITKPTPPPEPIKTDNIDKVKHPSPPLVATRIPPPPPLPSITIFEDQSDDNLILSLSKVSELNIEDAASKVKMNDDIDYKLKYFESEKLISELRAEIKELSTTHVKNNTLMNSSLVNTFVTPDDFYRRNIKISSSIQYEHYFPLEMTVKDYMRRIMDNVSNGIKDKVLRIWQSNQLFSKNSSTSSTPNKFNHNIVVKNNTPGKKSLKIKIKTDIVSLLLIILEKDHIDERSDLLLLSDMLILRSLKLDELTCKTLILSTESLLNLNTKINEQLIESSQLNKFVSQLGLAFRSASDLLNCFIISEQNSSNGHDSKSSIALIELNELQIQLQSHANHNKKRMSDKGWYWEILDKRLLNVGENDGNTPSHQYDSNRPRKDSSSSVKFHITPSKIDNNVKSDKKKRRGTKYNDDYDVISAAANSAVKGRRGTKFNMDPIIDSLYDNYSSNNNHTTSERKIRKASIYIHPELSSESPRSSFTSPNLNLSLHDTIEKSIHGGGSSKIDLVFESVYAQLEAALSSSEIDITCIFVRFEGIANYLKLNANSDDNTEELIYSIELILETHDGNCNVDVPETNNQILNSPNSIIVTKLTDLKKNKVNRLQKLYSLLQRSKVLIDNINSMLDGDYDDEDTEIDDDKLNEIHSKIYPLYQLLSNLLLPYTPCLDFIDHDQGGAINHKKTNDLDLNPEYTSTVLFYNVDHVDHASIGSLLIKAGLLSLVKVVFTNLYDLKLSAQPPQKGHHGRHKSMKSSASPSHHQNQLHQFFQPGEMIPAKLIDVDNIDFSITASLHNAGFNFNQISASGGFSKEEILSAGCPIGELMSMGYGVAELRIAGYSVRDCRQAGFNAAQLKEGGFDEVVVVNSGGFSLAHLRSAGCDVQKYALMGFFESTGGKYWRKSTNWGSSKPVSEWFGIGVNNSGKVITLSLRSNYLRGNIPESISLLTSLQYLDLDNNQLVGSIPDSLSTMVNLSDLWLSGNHLSIPTVTRTILHYKLPKCTKRLGTN
jgi:hypothetical protein